MIDTDFYYMAKPRTDGVTVYRAKREGGLNSIQRVEYIYTERGADNEKISESLNAAFKFAGVLDPYSGERDI